jgi:DNase/tRNase domain of colicin-like bacteriocin
MTETMIHPKSRCWISLWLMLCMVLSSLPLGCQSGKVKSPVAEDGRVYLPNETEEEIRKCATLVQKDAWPTQRSVDANVKFDEDGDVLEATTTSEPNPDVGQCIRVALKEMRVDKEVLANAALRTRQTSAQVSEPGLNRAYVGQVETVTVTVVTVVFVEVIVFEEVMVVLGVSVTGSLVLAAMNGAKATPRQEAVTRGTRKPHQPNAKKWMDNGGSIDEKADGTTTYTRSDGVKVTYNKEGFPDFTPYRHPTVKDVQIEFSGSYPKDFAAADKAAGITKEMRDNEKYTWHHHQDGKTMQLIKGDVHQDFFHTGGMAGTR